LQREKFSKKSKVVFSELRVIDDPTPRPGPLNMAIDEVLLTMARPAILRFYRWNAASVSFGYFVRFAEAHEIAGNRAVVRRWTGGGIVPHGEDLTYSIMIGAQDATFALPSKIIYQRVHSTLGNVLREKGILAVLTETKAPKISEACFANPVVSDVIESGRKIAGAAQRKTRIGLLHQGSIQRGNLDERFRNAFAQLLGQRIVEDRIGAGILRAAEVLATTKYATVDWLRRR
jgi:lipoate-protein ligase A